MAIAAISSGLNGFIIALKLSKIPKQSGLSAKYCALKSGQKDSLLEAAADLMCPRQKYKFFHERTKKSPRCTKDYKVQISTTRLNCAFCAK
jgi:hypothetical protein